MGWWGPLVGTFSSLGTVPARGVCQFRHVSFHLISSLSLTAERGKTMAPGLAPTANSGSVDYDGIDGLIYESTLGFAPWTSFTQQLTQPC